MKLAVVTTHPIQYNAPWFKLLAGVPAIELMVFYTWEQSQSMAKHDPDFGKVIEWDVPLLEGYQFTFVENVSQQPGSHHYKGIDNPTLISDISKWGAEAVLVFGWAFKSHLAVIRHFKGKLPILFRGDSTLLDEKPGIKLLLRRLFLRYIYSFIDFALYVGQNNKKYFLAHGVKEEQLIFTPHAIDNDRFVNQSASLGKDIRLWKQELGIDEDAFVILFAGKFIEKKNPAYIIELAKRIQDENVRFILVGNGKLEIELKQQALDERILFLGFQNQQKMPLVYNLCNVFVLPSTGPNETWGLAINEAIACGKFIITTTQVGCAVDMVKKYKNGLIVEPNDVDSAAEYIKSIMNNTTAAVEKDKVNAELLAIFSYKSIVSAISNVLLKIKNAK